MPPSDQRIADLDRELTSLLAVTAGRVASARSRLEAEPPDAPAARRDLDQIARNCARTAQLIRGLLAELRASRPEPPGKQRN